MADFVFGAPNRALICRLHASKAYKISQENHRKTFKIIFIHCTQKQSTKMKCGVKERLLFKWKCLYIMSYFYDISGQSESQLYKFVDFPCFSFEIYETLRKHRSQQVKEKPNMYTWKSLDARSFWYYLYIATWITENCKGKYAYSIVQLCYRPL